MSSAQIRGAAAGPIGGASGDGGIEYQRAVAAYAVAHGLARLPLPGFGFEGDNAEVVAVAAQTDHPVDDLCI